MNEPAPLLELRGIDKRFGAVHANRSVDLVLHAGEVLGLLGENGAGKTTLMNILFGLYQADAGEIRIAGRAVTIRGPADASLRIPPRNPSLRYIYLNAPDSRRSPSACIHASLYVVLNWMGICI